MKSNLYNELQRQHSDRRGERIWTMTAITLGVASIAYFIIHFISFYNYSI